MKIEQDMKASRIEETFAVGNGHMGALLYGGTITDRIELLEDTFIGKSRRGKRKPLSTLKSFGMNRSKYGMNLPVGQITVTHNEYTGFEEILDYNRSLELETGIAETKYKLNGLAMHVQAFASCPHNMLVYEVTSENKNMNIGLSFEKFREGDTVRYHMGGMFFICQAPESMGKSDIGASLLLGKVSLYTDGFPQAEEDGLTVRNASRMALYITFITDFKEPKLEKEAQILQLQMKMNRVFVKMEDDTFEQIVEAHKADRKKCTITRRK